MIWKEILIGAIGGLYLGVPLAFFLIVSVENNKTERMMDLVAGIVVGPTVFMLLLELVAIPSALISGSNEDPGALWLLNTLFIVASSIFLFFRFGITGWSVRTGMRYNSLPKWKRILIWTAFLVVMWATSVFMMDWAMKHPYKAWAQ